ncbi:EscU/YscU/HrcU family type III secretion system export apparatus switch protein [Chthonobacter albigriseus]|uniref:EscU/YscU/HrcU family type III secretion system export apparatus switch protein n=1 Tax=Chthonobacter albigriseus TaxID=1683161 RepID=UPI0015EF2EFA|nr:EscU/YscU/HrcU family type III secretion system export apparatus switch protein [Chthonobacter albigriseus]
MSQPEDPPARIAVALRYEAPNAPTVVATGRGYVADEIVERAREAGVAIEENPLLAQALSRLELDEEIPVELYRAVAEVVGFVLRSAARR